MSDAERLVEEHLARLGVAATQIAFPVRATITRRSLERSAPPDPPGAVGPGLPRISLAATGPEGPPPAAGADLCLLATLGEGGMGQVYLARQRSLDREVAVKMLKSGTSADTAAALLREARVAGALEHPGVVPVHELGIDEEAAPSS